MSSTFKPKVALLGVNDLLSKNISLHISNQFKFSLIPFLSSKVEDDIFVVLIYHAPPLYDGLISLQQIKRSHPNVKIIILSSNCSKQDIVVAFHLGTNDFLFLPFQPESLLHSLNRLKSNEDLAANKKWWVNLLPSFFFRKKTRMVLSSPVPQLSINKEPIQSTLVLEEKENLNSNMEVQFLGYFNLSINGEPLPKCPGKKGKALLANILFHAPKPIHREILIKRFWDNSTTDSARNCLNVTLHTIRKVFQKIAPNEDIICYKDESYFINSNYIIERDTKLVEKYWNEARQVERTQGMHAAVNIYNKAFELLKGDFLEDLPYERWAEKERERYREIWLVILDRLAAHFLECGKFEMTLNICEQILTKDNCLEEVHRRLMKCYFELGMKDRAIRQYHKCTEILMEELRIEPGLTTKTLYDSIIAK